MSSKLYLNNNRLFPAYFPPVWHGGWDHVTTGFINYAIDPDSYGHQSVFIHNNQEDPNYGLTRWAVYRAASRILMPQTISGTVDMVFALGEYYMNSHPTTRLHIYVINIVTNTVLTTLLNQFEDTIEWFHATDITNSKGTSLSSPQTLTSCTIPAIDASNMYRLIIEFGSKTNISSGNPAVQSGLYAGSRGVDPNYAPLSDLAVNQTPGAGYAGYFTFSDDILLVPWESTNFTKSTAATITIPTDTLINTGGQDLWYKYTGTASRILGVYACAATTNPVILNIIMDNGSTFLEYPGVDKKPIQVGVESGEIIHFHFYVQNLTGSAEVPVNLDVQLGPIDTVQVGDLLITDDEDNFPAVWFVPGTGVVRHISDKFIASELGATLTNGKWALAVQDSPYGIRIYDKPPNLTQLSNTSFPVNKFPRTMGTDFTYFYVVLDDTPTMPMYKVDEAGIINSTVTHIPYSSVSIGYTSGTGGQGGMGFSRDGLIAYYGHKVVGASALRRHDMVNDVELLPAFISPGTTYLAGEVIVLSDNTVLCNFHDETSGTHSHKTLHYDTNGTVLHVINHGVKQLHHITHSVDDDSDKFWAWTQGLIFTPESFMNRLQLIQISTGAILIDWSVPMFNAGISAVPGVSTCDAVSFGAPSSCPLLMMMETSVSIPGMGGIYYINPTKATRHDSYYGDTEKKIPNPTIRTGFMGE